MATAFCYVSIRVRGSVSPQEFEINNTDVCCRGGELALVIMKGISARTCEKTECVPCLPMPLPSFLHGDTAMSSMKR